MDSFGLGNGKFDDAVNDISSLVYKYTNGRTARLAEYISMVIRLFWYPCLLTLAYQPLRW
jgi:hypothetical protein